MGKKSILFGLLLICFFSSDLMAQVGVNTTSPNTSLDVQASRNSNGVIDNNQFFGIQAPRITRAELTNYTGSYGSGQNGALIYISDVSGGNALASSPREFVTSIGYYYFESSSNKWRRVADNTSSGSSSAVKAENGLTATADNIVKIGGTLKETTKITQGINSFVFQGANTAYNTPFSTYTNVAVNTDPSNTTTPTLRVTYPVSSLNPALLISGVNNGTDLAVGQASIIGLNPNNKSGIWPIGIGAEYINSATDQGSADFFISTSSGGSATKKFVVTNAGKVGINTVSPQKTLHVNGSLQLTNELNVGGTSTTAGSSGTSGQVLVSKGAGYAPAWTTLDGLVSTTVKSSNGLTTTSDNIVKLGGTLQESTKITQGTNNFVFQGTNAATNAAFNTYANVNINTNPDITTIPTLRVAHPVHTVDPVLLLSGINNGPDLAVGQSSFIGFNPNSKSGYWPVGIGAEYINSATNQGSADFFISTSSGGTATKKFVVTNTGRVGINTTTPASTLDVRVGETTSPEGIIAPRLTLQELISRTPFYATDQTGAILYINNISGNTSARTRNITSIGYYYYDGINWQPFSKSSTTSDYWSINGNNNLTALRGENYLGTSNATDLVFKTNSVEQMTISSAGNVGIGTNSPTNKLHIKGTNPMKVEGLSKGVFTTSSILSINANNVVEAIPASDIISQLGGGGSTSTDNKTWYVAGTTTMPVNNTQNIYRQGRVGIGTTNPTNNLHIAGTNPVKIDGLSTGVFKTSSMLSVNSQNVVEKIPSTTIAEEISNMTSVPVPNVYTLSKTLSNFLSTSAAGYSQVITDLVETKAAIKGMTFDQSTSTITFPPGTYQIFVTYEGLHDATGCTISSYFVDFPTEGDRRRVHSTASHIQGALSNHGGTVSYAVTLKNTFKWQAHLGRGQSGNCLGSGMTLSELSTQILIFRIGD